MKDVYMGQLFTKSSFLASFCIASTLIMPFEKAFAGNVKELEENSSPLSRASVQQWENVNKSYLDAAVQEGLWASSASPSVLQSSLVTSSQSRPASNLPISSLSPSSLTSVATQLGNKAFQSIVDAAYAQEAFQDSIHTATHQPVGLLGTSEASTTLAQIANPDTSIAPEVSPSAPLSIATRTQLSTTFEQYYYNWSDELGNQGSQWVLPLTFTLSSGNFDLGIRTAYINSQFDGVLLLDGTVIGKRQGQVSTLSDTSVSLAYTFKESDWPVRLNLDFNIPTGKATLVGNEKNAIMDGALVQQTRFGEGFNVAPGISVTKALSDRDVLGLGASYIFRGAFDPNGDVTSDEIDPGNEAVATLQYQHTGENVLFMGGLIYTNYGVTTRGGEEYYRSGDRLDANATLLFSPFPGNRIQLSGRYFTQAPNDIINFFTGGLQRESANSNGNALFLSLDWGLALDPEQRHTIHFLADTLNVQANSYDPVSDLYNAGRNRFSAGLGYEYAISQTSRFQVQAKLFNLLDKATPITQRDVSASGYTLYGTVNFSF